MPKLGLGDGLGGIQDCILKLMQLPNINIRRSFQLLLTGKNVVHSTSAGHSENGLVWSKERAFLL